LRFLSSPLFSGAAKVPVTRNQAVVPADFGLAMLEAQTRRIITLMAVARIMADSMVADITAEGMTEAAVADTIELLLCENASCYFWPDAAWHWPVAAAHATVKKSQTLRLRPTRQRLPGVLSANGAAGIRPGRTPSRFPRTARFIVPGTMRVIGRSRTCKTM
jgi:hypothetical protein